jgi:hypothetical protein
MAQASGDFPDDDDAHSEQLPRLLREVLGRFQQVQALTVGATQVARDQIEELADADPPPWSDQDRRLRQLHQWLDQAEQLLSDLMRVSETISTLTLKVTNGHLDPRAEQLRRLHSSLEQLHTQTDEQIIESLASRGLYNEACAIAKKVLSNAERPEQAVNAEEAVEEFQSLQTDIEQLTNELEEDARDADTRTDTRTDTDTNTNNS